MVRLSIMVVLATLCAGCAGEVTTLEFGDAEEISQRRFAEEIFPILHSQDTGAVDGVDSAPGACDDGRNNPNCFIRDCSDARCHGRDNPFGQLPVAPAINDTNALDTFRAALDNGQLILGDADGSSFLQHTFMDGRHPNCYPSRTDCCFLKVEAWINGVDPPGCDDCPTEDLD
jgi:hypothetical protein